MNRRRLISAALVACVAVAACRGKKKPIQVVTTHEVAGTGLPQQVLDAFTRQGNAPVRLTEVSSKQFIATVEKTQPDVVIINDEQLLAALTASRLIRLRSTVMQERFVIVGPARDPARIHSAKSLTEALQRIVERRSPFCSPVDSVRLRERESILWSSAAIDPRQNSRYRECKGDAAQVLSEAARRQAYTLTDRDTFQQNSPRRMKELFSNTPLLNDDFVVVLLRTAKANRDAEWLVEWSMSVRAREVIDAIEAKRN